MIRFSILIISLLALLASCKKDKDETNDDQYVIGVKAGEYSLSRLTDRGEDWIYYSFENQMEISGIDNSNYKLLDNWDIAFNKFNIRTNSGLSTNNIGNGGAFDTQSTDWTSIIEAPIQGYSVDTIIEILKDTNDYVYVNSTGSQVLSKWIDFSGPPPVYTISDHIYILKTAKGKYAKLWLKSYHNELGESGYVTFKYAYQEDGSRNFQ